MQILYGETLMAVKQVNFFSFRTSRVYANDYYLLLFTQNSVKGKLPLESTGSITTPTTSMNYETFVSLNRERGL